MGDAMRVEIFAAGKHLGRDWTTADLDTIVANHARLREHVTPALKLGHTGAETQWIAKMGDGAPALGWVERVERVGDKLVADVVNVPKFLRDAIDQKRYRRVSSEFYTDWSKTPYEENLKTGAHGPVLGAVAMLGATPPIVKNLADLGTLLAAEGMTDVQLSEEPGPDAIALTAHESRVPTHPRNQERSPETPEDEGMTNEEKKALFAEIAAEVTQAVEAKWQGRVTDLQGEVTKLSEANAAEKAEKAKLSEQIATLSGKVATAEATAKHAEADKWVRERSTKDNLRIFPTQKAAAIVLSERLSNEIIVDGPEAKAAGLEERPYTARELFAEFVDKRPATALTTEQLQADTQPKPKGMEQRVAEIAKERGLNLAVHSERAQALNIYASEPGADVPDYRSPEFTRH